MNALNDVTAMTILSAKSISKTERHLIVSVCLCAFSSPLFNSVCVSSFYFLSIFKCTPNPILRMKCMNFSFSKESILTCSVWRNSVPLQSNLLEVYSNDLLWHSIKKTSCCAGKRHCETSHLEALTSLARRLSVLVWEDASNACRNAVDMDRLFLRDSGRSKIPDTSLACLLGAGAVVEVWPEDQLCEAWNKHKEKGTKVRKQRQESSERRRKVSKQTYLKQRLKSLNCTCQISREQVNSVQPCKQV